MKAWFLGLGVRQYVLGAAVLFLTLTTLWLVHSYNSAIEQAQTERAARIVTEAALKTASEELGLAKARTAQLDKTLTEKGRYEAQQRAEFAQRRQRDDELARQDPAVRAWMDVPIPDSLRQRGDTQRGQDGVPVAGGSSDRADDGRATSNAGRSAGQR